MAPISTPHMTLRMAATIAVLMLPPLSTAHALDTNAVSILAGNWSGSGGGGGYNDRW